MREGGRGRERGRGKERGRAGLETDFFPNLPNGQVVVISGCPYKSCNCPNIL